MDTKILSDWLIGLASAQNGMIYYVVNSSVRGPGQLYEYPEEGHRVCVIHPIWVNQAYEICNEAGISMRWVGETSRVAIADKMDLLRKMVELKSAISRKGGYYALTWNNQRISSDLVHALHRDRLLDTRGANLYVVTEAGKAKAMEI